MKVQWTEQLVATQQQKTEQIKKETEKMRAIADAERNKAVLKIKIEERLLEKEGERNTSALQNVILKERQENEANILKYSKEKEAEGNDNLYTDKYVQMSVAKSLSSNAKIFFSGDNSALAGVMNAIFKKGN